MFYEGKDIKHLATTNDYGYIMLENGDKFAIKIISSEEYEKHIDEIIKKQFKELQKD